MNIETLTRYMAVLTIVAVVTIVVLYPVFQVAKYDYRYLYATDAYGFSMLPTIHSGDLLVVALKDSPYFNPETGDILVYSYNEKINVAHRLVRVEGDYYIFKGDNNNYYEKVPEDAIIGEVIEVIPSSNPIAQYAVQGLLPPP